MQDEIENPAVFPSLKGKSVFITGGGSGIGEGLVRHFCQQGAKVTFVDIATKPAHSLVELIAMSGLTAPTFIECDLRDIDSLRNAIAQCAQKQDPIRVLVNNAGIGPIATAEETSWELWDEVMAVNLEGPFIGCKKAIPLMRKRGGGAIVNLASINAIRGNTRLVAYAATKGGVMAMTMSLALDHIAENIRVNCVCPATIETPMIHEMLGTAPDRDAATRGIIAKHPIGRMAQPEEVASTIAFLASGDASFMTGLAIPVDGGRSIR